MTTDQATSGADQTHLSSGGAPYPGLVTPVTRGSGQAVPVNPYGDDIAEVLISADDIAGKIAQLAAAVADDHARRGGGSLLLVGVLKGAALMMADIARVLTVETSMDFMAISSYGTGTRSSGVVRILKDLDREIDGRHVLVVEDIIDSGLTLTWLLKNLASRNPASVEVCALLRKPEGRKVPMPVRYVGFDIPDEFVVGYGLDYAERYRDLPFVGRLRPEVFAGG